MLCVIAHLQVIFASTSKSRYVGGTEADIIYDTRGQGNGPAVRLQLSVIYTFVDLHIPACDTIVAMQANMGQRIYKWGEGPLLRSRDTSKHRIKTSRAGICN